MYATGLIGGQRPDRAARVLLTLTKGGATPASAIRIARIKRPDREFIVDEQGSLTFAEVDRRTNALARAFAAHGVAVGDAIGIMCRNHRGFLEANLAASKLGATVVFLNTMFSGPQLTEVVTRERPAILVADQEFEDLLESLPEGIVQIRGFTEPQTAGDESGFGGNAGPEAGRVPVSSLEELIATADDGQMPLPDGTSRYIILTSGTTGTPKGAQRSSPKSLATVLGLLDLIPHRKEETMVVAAPLFHSWGFINSVIGLSVGARLVMDRRFDPERTMELVDRYRADVLVAVPVMLQRILELDPARSDRFETENLKIVTLSGSALPGGLATVWMDRYGDNVYNLYGSTEVAFATVANPADLRADPATAGRIPRGTSIRLIGDDGRDVAASETGRIFVRNGMTFEGYTGGGNKEKLDDYIASGDLGHFDSEGRLHIDGRDDEMIVSGGENIFPGEIEDLLAGHPDVIEAAVTGVDDPRFGQTLRAYVVRREKAGIDEARLKAYVKANLAAFKAPRDVIFMSELPRNATGKVLKRKLADEENPADPAG